MKFLRYIVLSYACVATLGVNAQSDRAFVRQGNRLYRQQVFDKAEVEYRKVLAKYENAAKVEQGKIRKAKIYHNMGVICQRHQMFAEAIKAYEESLRNNPADNETRYNLALCKRKQKQQQGGGQDNKDDKNKDKKKQQKQQQEKQEQKPEQQQPKEQMSKENAEQLLNAAMQEEKATQQRMKEKMRQPQRRQLQKNW